LLADVPGLLESAGLDEIIVAPLNVKPVLLPDFVHVEHG
jgi:hypothetical protein